MSSTPAHDELARARRVAVIGDSLIAGYGVNGRSYAQLVAEHVGAEKTMFYARSTFTVLDALRLQDRVRAFEPDLVLMSVGGSECLVHAGKTVERLLERFAPKSWQGVQGLEPVTVLAPSPWVRRRQRVTGLIKLALKHIGVRLTGGYRRVEPDVFADAYGKLVAQVGSLGCTVVSIGLHRVSSFTWPRSSASADEYEEIMTKALAPYPDVLIVDPKPVLVPKGDFLDDGAHLSEQGHAKVAKLIIAALDNRTASRRTG